MNEVLQKKFNAQRETIEAMCERFGVASLDLFGPATAPDWRPDTSDLDSVVTFDSVQASTRPRRASMRSDAARRCQLAQSAAMFFAPGQTAWYVAEVKPTGATSIDVDVAAHGSPRGPRCGWVG